MSFVRLFDIFISCFVFCVLCSVFYVLCGFRWWSLFKADFPCSDSIEIVFFFGFVFGVNRWGIDAIWSGKCFKNGGRTSSASPTAVDLVLSCLVYLVWISLLRIQSRVCTWCTPYLCLYSVCRSPRLSTYEFVRLKYTQEETQSCFGNCWGVEMERVCGYQRSWRIWGHI